MLACETELQTHKSETLIPSHIDDTFFRHDKSMALKYRLSSQRGE